MGSGSLTEVGWIVGRLSELLLFSLPNLSSLVQTAQNDNKTYSYMFLSAVGVTCSNSVSFSPPGAFLKFNTAFKVSPEKTIKIH